MFWKIRVLFIRLLRRSGEFSKGEVSARAAQLTSSWDAQWPGDAPIGYRLREAHFDRWVRFHSLPNSKRNADSSLEKHELLHRYRTVLHGLITHARVGRLQVIAVDWDAKDYSGGWTKKHLPGAWPWRTFFDPADFEPGEALRFHYFWVSEFDLIDELDPLLLLAAEGVCQFIVADATLTWIFAPYEGGADVILSDERSRDDLALKHGAWLSGHPLGL